MKTTINSLILFLGMLLASPIANAYHVVSKEAGIDLNTEKVVKIKGGIDPSMARSVRSQLQRIEKLKGDILVLIDSPGGLNVSGLDIMKELDKRRKSDVRLVCVAHNDASSMAFNILTKCDIRLATKRTTMVVHKLEYMTLPPYSRLTATFLRKLADEIDKDDAPFKEANQKAMGLTSEEYDKYADEETMWLATTLLKRGYLHGIASIMK